MQVTTTATAGTSGLFPGLFGQQNQAGGGLFGMLMAVFGQNMGQTTGQNLTGQNLPTGQALADGTLPKMPTISLVSLEGQLTLGQQADIGAQLMPLLQQLSTNPTISAQLKNLLAGGESLDMATLQQRLAGLDESTRESVMGEIAGLLQPMLAAQQPIVITPTDGGDNAIVDGLPATTPANAAPTAPATPMDAPEQAATLPVNAAPEAPVEAPTLDAAVTPSAMPVDAEAARATTTAQAAVTPDASAHTRKDGKARDARATAAADAAVAKINEQGALNLSAFEALKPEERADLVQRAAKLVQGTQEKTNQQTAATTTAPAAAAAQPQQTQAPTDVARTSTTKEATGTIKATASAGDGATDAGLKNLLPDNTATQTQTAAPQDKSATQSTSFANHLESVKLNRTGAHMPVADQISVQMNRAVAEGKDRFTVKLSPGDLGRIEVRIEVGSDGQVMASFKVDQPATLDLLQRDQRGLERALSDAGLKADSGSLNFNLRDNGNSQQQQQQAQNNSQGNGNGRPGFSLDGDMAIEDIPAAGTMEVSWYVGADRLDVRV